MERILGMVQTWRLSGRIPRPLRVHPAGAGVRQREGEEGVRLPRLPNSRSRRSRRQGAAEVLPGHEPCPRSRCSPHTCGLLPCSVCTAGRASDLPAEGFGTMGFDAAELVTDALWQRPPGTAECRRRPWWPENGRVLACYWSLSSSRSQTGVTVILEEGSWSTWRTWRPMPRPMIPIPMSFPAVNGMDHWPHLLRSCVKSLPMSASSSKGHSTGMAPPDVNVMPCACGRLSTVSTT